MSIADARCLINALLLHISYLLPMICISSMFNVRMHKQAAKVVNTLSGSYYSYTVKLLNNGHAFCRGLVAVIDDCPLVRGCGKMSTNPHVWRVQDRLIYTKSVSRSFRPTKK